MIIINNNNNYIIFIIVNLLLKITSSLRLIRARMVSVPGSLMLELRMREHAWRPMVTQHRRRICHTVCIAAIILQRH